MLKYLVLDIETLPHPDAESWLPPVQAAANLKDPVKIAASIAERQADRADKLGLDPDCLRICAIGWHLPADGGDPMCLIAKTEAEEADALRQLAEAYAAPKGRQETRFVTFFGRSFDLPVLMRRAMYLNVQFPAISLDRYRSCHVDVHDALTFSGALRTAHSLAFYAKRMGFVTSDTVHGGDVRTLAAAGHWEAIRQHCVSDVQLTYLLAKRLGLLDS